MRTEEKIGDFDFNNVLKFLPDRIRNVLLKVSLSQIEEIRLRAGKALMLQNSSGDVFVSPNGKAMEKFGENCFFVSRDEVIWVLENMSENSIYAFVDEIKNGFITLEGGHRVGISGRVVIENNKVKNIKDVSGLNIRISRQVIGCSKNVINSIVDAQNQVQNTLIISPPACGKTTILRDVARQLSDGIDEINFRGHKVGIVDERSEIAACFKGVPQNMVGVRTDVLDACPKSIGIPILLRSMSPEVIITDEIGNSGDKDALLAIVNAGVKVITSAHGYNISELKTRKEVISLIDEGVFDKFVVLSRANGPGTLEEIIDGDTMECVYRRMGNAS